MEEERADGSRRSHPTAEQYLFALIACAEWVPQSYKDIARENMNDVEYLKELYLCSCDGVPAEKVRETKGKRSPSGALRILRQKYIEERIMGESGTRLERIARKASTLEKKLDTVEGMVNQLTGNIPDLEALFKEDVPESGTQKEPEKDVPESGTQKEPEKDVPESGTQKKPEDYVPESGTRRWRFWKRAKRKKDVDLTAYVENLMESGYSMDQLNFLMDCLEDGMDPGEIDAIASPKIPVEIMRRLRILKEHQKDKKETGKAAAEKSKK